MQKYCKPEMEVEELTADDVIITSGLGGDGEITDVTGDGDNPWIGKQGQ